MEKSKFQKVSLRERVKMITVNQLSQIDRIPVRIESTPKFSRKLYRLQIKEHRAEIRRCRLRSKIIRINTKLGVYGS